MLQSANIHLYIITLLLIALQTGVGRLVYAFLANDHVLAFHIIDTAQILFAQRAHPLLQENLTNSVEHLVAFRLLSVELNHFVGLFQKNQSA